jgi:hypothetical protein
MTSYAGISMLQCSSCAGHIHHLLLASGNTFGARRWTDGWQDAPMMPEQTSLVKCPHCRAMVWFSELEEVAKFDNFIDSDRNFPDAAGYLEPDYADYLQYVAENTELSENRQRYARKHAWWRGGVVTIPAVILQLPHLCQKANVTTCSSLRPFLIGTLTLTELRRPRSCGNWASLLPPK